MRRTAMYLGGLLLATGASLALAGPATAAPAGGCCDDDERILVLADDDYYDDCDDDSPIVVLGGGHGHGHGHGHGYHNKHHFGGNSISNINAYDSFKSDDDFIDILNFKKGLLS